MLWRLGAQNFGLSNHNLKSVLKYTIYSQYTPIPERQTERQADEHHVNSMTTIRSNKYIMC